MKALSLFGDTIPAPVTAHAGQRTASGQAVAKEHRTARRGGLDLMTAAALAETPRRDTAVAKPDKAPAGPEPHEELKAYAEAHGTSDLAWVTVPVGDPNFPSRERLAAMGRDALEFALARVRTKVARERIQAALHLIDKRQKAPAARGVERRSSRRRGPARKEPDFGLAVAPEVPGMPPYMRVAVDWPRLHGSCVRLEVNTEDLELRVPAVVSVEEPQSYGAQLVTCGFRHGCGLRDWAYVDGRLHPILREVRHQPNSKILPPRIATEIAVVPDGADQLANPGKAWPNDLADGAGREVPWRDTLEALVGCLVSVGLWLHRWSGSLELRSAPFVLVEWSLEDGRLVPKGESEEVLRARVEDVRGARLWAMASDTHVIIDAGCPGSGYVGITLYRP